MAATFPGGVKSFSTKNPGDAILSTHVNELQEEVVAVETELRKTSGSVVDHGGLAGLSDNDHPQYLLAATGKAADADRLDGIDSSGYVNTSHQQSINGEKIFTTIPTLPASDPTSNNQAARKAYVDSIILKVYPVGSIYMSVNSTSPATLFGGTWVAWGTGRVPVGINTGDTDFNTVEKTGGAKTHSHSLSAGWAKIAASTDNWIGTLRKTVTSWTTTHKSTATTAADATVTSSGTDLGGNTDDASNLPPYIVCYMWKRTA